jgi:pimeloyl-ACP methyl ester carboxylesterase
MATPESVKCPALAFAGGEDQVTPVDASKEIAAAMPHGEFSTVPDGAHWCHLELPEVVSERLLGLLRTAAAG